MGNKDDNCQDIDYFDDSNKTETIQSEFKKEEEKVVVDEKAYGVNKPSRIIIRAKISHD